MVFLLALLVLLVSASLVALLAWTATRSNLPFVAAALLIVSSTVVMFQLLDHEDDLRVGGADQAQAEAALQDEATPTAVTPTVALEMPSTEAPPPTQAPEPTPPPEPTPSGPVVAVRPGDDSLTSFVVQAVTDVGQFSMPTSFAIGGEGELYVGHDDGIGIARDTTGDGYYDDMQHFGLEGGWVFGLDYYEGAVYAAVAGSTLRLRDLDGDDAADEIVTLTDGLPHNVYGGHSNSGLEVGPDGMLYMAIGGTSDHGPELEPLGGTILTMGIDGGEPQVFATGFRNPYDLAFCPDQRLYAVDNGPDQIDEELTSLPWDEVNLIHQDGNYGYPDYFGPVPSETGTLSPITRVAPSAGITGITCSSGTAYPEAFRGNLFVTLWGTFTYPIETGRKVMRVEIEETPEGPRGTTTEFASGFGHPIDIVEDLQGNLLVLDYEFGQVFRIRYAGAS